MASENNTQNKIANNQKEKNQEPNKKKKSDSSEGGQYLARTKDGTTNPKANNNNSMNKPSNKKKEENNNDPKDAAKQHAKEQAATAAMSALGVPAPLAKTLSKSAVNKLDKNLLNEKQQINQGQERLQKMRNMAGAMQESKKQKEQDESEEEPQKSIIDEASDIKAKAENISGLIKFIKMVPAPAWGVIVGIIVLFFLLLFMLSAVGSLTVSAGNMNVDEEYIQERITEKEDEDSNKDTPPNQGSGKLGYPTSSRSISAGYPNYSSGRYHGGVDFPVPVGTDVYAAESGEVIVKKELNESYGYYLYIKHDNGLCTLYAHNSKLLVNKGDRVTKGQVIAKSGDTGNSTGPHCHFEVRKDCGVSGGTPSGTTVDPNDYLSD